MKNKRSNESNERRTPPQRDEPSRPAAGHGRKPVYSRHDTFDASSYGRPTASGSTSQPQAAEKLSQSSRSTLNSTARSSRSRADRSRAQAPPRDSDAQRSTTRRTSQRAYAQEAQARRRKKMVRITLATVLALFLCGGGVAFAYYQVLSGNLHSGIDQRLREALVQTDLANEPFYLLLMGTDGSNDRAESEEYAGDQFRSDSIILARIDPVNKKTTMVSIHRDTLVDMGEYGKNKLNAAHALGGAALMVETVSKLAGVPISHYAEINFDGFKDIVDSLGGVDVDVPMTIDDEDAGGHLDQGSQTLTGDQALILCRSRHAYDEFGDGDSYRAANQRLVLAAIAKKILAADVATMANTVTSLTNYVTTDLEISDIVGLAQTLQGLDPSTDIYSGMEPTTSAYINNIWYEINNAEAWAKMMERVDQGLPPTEDDIVDDSGTILASTGSGSIETKQQAQEPITASTPGSVAVRNGNGLSGAGSTAAKKLQDKGYKVETGNAESFDYSQTIVVYSKNNQATEAKDIAKTIGVGKAQLNDGSYVFETDFLVVLGADWA